MSTKVDWPTVGFVSLICLLVIGMEGFSNPSLIGMAVLGGLVSGWLEANYGEDI